MSRRKLLLADDSITIQKVVNLTFADEGIEVIAVGDGNSALDRMQETPPDLVMADVNMPGLSGYQLCERVKQNERLRHIPVILLVGSFEPFDEAEAARVGADDYLTKPFQSIRQLVNKVTGMLEQTESRRAAAENSSPASNFADVSATVEESSEPSAATDSSAVENRAEYDAETDDETIQTSYAGSFPLDETQKFESSAFETEDAGKTQPLSVHDLKDFAFVEETAREFQTTERIYETTEESPAADSTETASAAPRPAPPVFDFDDFNLLEIPFNEGDEEIGAASAAEETPVSTEAETRASVGAQPEISSAATEAVENFSGDASEQMPGDSSEVAEAEFVEEIKEAEEGKTIAETEAETAAETQPEAETQAATENAAPPPAQNFSFPPELIEAIAQRVADKLSARTASEVAPQVADIIIQKMAEEKLKQ